MYGGAASSSTVIILAAVVVVLTGLYLVGLAFVGIARPDRAKRFLEGFAASGVAHYAELLVRILVGLAMVLAHEKMLYSRSFLIFGLVLLGSSAVLMLFPWRVHRRFALWAVPYAVQHVRLLALASFVIGMTVLMSIILGAGMSGY